MVVRLIHVIWKEETLARAGELGSGENGCFAFSKLVTSSFVFFSLLWLPTPLFTLHPFDLSRPANRYSGSDSTRPSNPNSPDFSDRTVLRVHRTTRPLAPPYASAREGDIAMAESTQLSPLCAELVDPASSRQQPRQIPDILTAI
jgi:hypothetical protein